MSTHQGESPRYSGDIPEAIVAGADAVMLGNALAGVAEAPGDVIVLQGGHYKAYRAMGPLGAMKDHSFSKDRCFQGPVTENEKLVLEGVEGRAAYKGPLVGIAHQLVGAFARPWATAAPPPPGVEGARRVRPQHLGPACGRATRMTPPSPPIPRTTVDDPASSP